MRARKPEGYEDLCIEHKELVDKHIKRQIEKYVKTFCRRQLDIVIMASIITLIEEFEFGTVGNKVKINRFVDGLMRVMNEYIAEYGEDAAREAMILHLKNSNVNLKI